MTSEQLQNHIRRRPFQPFTIYMADGEKLPVPHPEVILHIPGARTFVVAHEKQKVYSTIDLLLVARIATLPQSRGAGRGRANGRAA